MANNPQQSDEEVTVPSGDYVDWHNYDCEEITD